MCSSIRVTWHQFKGANEPCINKINKLSTNSKYLNWENLGIWDIHKKYITSYRSNMGKKTPPHSHLVWAGAPCSSNLLGHLRHIWGPPCLCDPSCRRWWCRWTRWRWPRCGLTLGPNLGYQPPSRSSPLLLFEKATTHRQTHESAVVWAQCHMWGNLLMDH